MSDAWHRYQKKPVVIEAKGPYYKTAVIETPEGHIEIDEEYAKEGYFIVKGVDGEIYPCKEDIFYENHQTRGGNPSDAFNDKWRDKGV